MGTVIRLAEHRNRFRDRLAAVAPVSDPPPLGTSAGSVERRWRAENAGGGSDPNVPASSAARQGTQQFSPEGSPCPSRFPVLRAVVFLLRRWRRAGR